MTQALLQVTNLSVGLENQCLLHDVNFEVHRGKTFALLGESGSGKTLSALSVVRLLPRAIRFYSGSIHFCGADLLRTPESQMEHIRGKKISFIFQEPATALNPVFTIGQQISEVLRLCKNTYRHALQKEVEKLLDHVGIDAPRRVIKSYPHELSGGMKQRAVIAIAIAGDPQLLIADEPTTALDVTVQAQVLALLKTLQKRLGMAMLFISHDLAIVANVADSLAIMRDGRIIEHSDSVSFHQLTHPYSRCLLRAVLTLDKRAVVLSGNSRSMIETEQNVRDQNILAVRDLSVHFPVRSGIFRRVTGYVRAVDGVSFELKKGQTLALVGESGSGKTTVAKAILRLVDNRTGTILFQRQDLDNLRGKAVRQFRQKVQVVLQDPFASMNPKLTVGEIIKEGMRAQTLYAKEAEMDKKVLWLLRKVGLNNVIQRYPHEFSGGQRQRLCIARALAVEPELLICDEPTSSLDVSIQAQILDLLHELQREQGLSYLFITHDIAVVAYMAHSIAVMRKGKIVESGETMSVLNQPIETYTKTLLASVPRLAAA